MVLDKQANTYAGLSGMTAVLIKPPRNKRAQRHLSKVIRCNLQRMMDEQGLSQMALAKETELAVGTIGNLSRNQFTRIDCETALVLCDYFNCDLCELFEMVSDK